MWTCYDMPTDTRTHICKHKTHTHTHTHTQGFHLFAGVVAIHLKPPNSQFSSSTTAGPLINTNPSQGICGGWDIKQLLLSILQYCSDHTLLLFLSEQNYSNCLRNSNKPPTIMYNLRSPKMKADRIWTVPLHVCCSILFDKPKILQCHKFWNVPFLKKTA